MSTTKIILSLILIGTVATAQGWSQKTQSIKTELTYSLWVDCVGEYAVGTLKINYLLHYDRDGNLVRWHRQPMGGTLTGTLTGTIYRAAGATQERLSGSYSLVDNTHLVGTGRDGVQTRYHMNMKYTVNANGKITAEVEHETIFCR
jgi:hypothetical protein